LEYTPGNPLVPQYEQKKASWAFFALLAKPTVTAIYRQISPLVVIRLRFNFSTLA
jgi:hypothetical protein